MERNPGLHQLAVDLLEVSGFKHWQLVKKSYGTLIRNEDDRHELIPLVQEQAGREAQQRLGELFAIDDLTALEPGLDPRRQARFVRFVDAANTISGKEVVSEEEKKAGCYSPGGKGANPDRQHDSMVPENARQAPAILHS